MESFDVFCVASQFQQALEQTFEFLMITGIMTLKWHHYDEFLSEENVIYLSHLEMIVYKFLNDTSLSTS